MAASNFLNVVGGIVAVLVFVVMTFTLDGIMATKLTEHAVAQDQTRLPQYVLQLERKMQIPHILFGLTSFLTGVAFVALTRLLPDFYLRTAIWLRAWGHNTLRTIGIEHMPTDGPVILLTNCNVFPAVLDLIAAVDRFPHVVLVEQGQVERSWLRKLAARSELIFVPAVPGAARWSRALQSGVRMLQNGEMVALTVNQPECATDIARLIDAWRATVPEAVVLPVCSTVAVSHAGQARVASCPYPRVIFGAPLPAQTPLVSAVTAIEQLALTAENE